MQNAFLKAGCQACNGIERAVHSGKIRCMQCLEVEMASREPNNSPVNCIFSGSVIKS